ncbi:DUF6461 domain-containing protein [Streptosporangium sp. NPDC087985]|uniref:DUF6461 domain-containing protein n=1 Tax=Streptosporangium sp. NPDC087985 TaxID=3366196 RepID=UPI003828C412
MPAEATADSYAWINHEGYAGLLISGLSVIFVRDRDHTSLLGALGLPMPVDEASMLTPGGPFIASVYAHPAGVTVVERGGYVGALRPVIEGLSTGTMAASISQTFETDIYFAYAEDGEVISAFNIDDPAVRHGRSPDAIAAHIADLGFPTFDDDLEEDEDEDEEEDIYAAVPGKRQLALCCALALATRLTGLRLTEDQLAAPLPRYSTSSLYSAGGVAAPIA